METMVGVFNSQAKAVTAYQELRNARFDENNLIVLTPRSPEEKIEQVPTEEGEQPGMGKAIGGVVGGAIGLAAGAAVGTLLLPGVGTILALGLTAAPLGIGGAVAGAAGGGALENLLTRGLPKDEIFLYEDALRKGRTVIIVLDDDEKRLELARAIMSRSGAESLDAAREQWWTGLRDADDARYEVPQNPEDEKIYRRGFEAALDPDLRGKSFTEAGDTLQQRFPDVCKHEWFQRGYVRAQAYYAVIVENGESLTRSDEAGEENQSHARR